MPKRAVILSGSLGSGHDVIAETVAGSLSRLGWESRTLDCMDMLGHRAGQAGDWVFRRMMTMPGVYDGLHYAHLRPGSRLAKAMDTSATSRLVPALQAELRREPADLIAAVFATGASTAARLGEQALGCRTIVLCADAVPHSLWVRDGIDLFLVTSPAAATSVRRYVPRAHVRVVPPPVRSAFYDPLPQAAARRPLGIPPYAGCALLMGGGWGLGPLEHAARALADAGGACAGRSGPQPPAGGAAGEPGPVRAAGPPLRLHRAYRRADERVRRGGDTARRHDVRRGQGGAPQAGAP